MHDGVSVRPRVAVTSHQRRHRKTYIGMRDEDKVFIKRNTTPMLAALSRKELHQNLFGQNEREWRYFDSTRVAGRSLADSNEIGQRNDVIDVLYHLHHSNSLKTMLTRIGGRVMTPEKMLQKYEKNYRKNSRKSISANCPSFSS